MSKIRWARENNVMKVTNGFVIVENTRGEGLSDEDDFGSRNQGEFRMEIGIDMCQEAK